jgi:NAD(P)-dependent dehydrogenase (short-subunit alcohol dehydrogenase family)
MASVVLSLHGKVALITGSGRGIGLGIAQALSRAGAAVAIQDIDLPVAQAESEKIRAGAAHAIALGGDVSDPAAAGAWIDQTVSQLGGLHILVNNAAIQSHRAWDHVPIEEIETQIRANLVTPIVLCQRAIPIFRQQQFGRVINLGSIQQVRGNPGMLPYSLSKAALEKLTKAVARSEVRNGITVNMLAPGFFRTWRNRDYFNDPQKVAGTANWVPIGRAGEPQDCAGIALFLCTDAASYITGQIIFVDGGMSS